MTKKVLCFIFVMQTLFASAQSEDYTLKIGDSTFKMSLDKEYKVIVNGKQVPLKLTQDDTLIYHGHNFSFRYLKSSKVSETKIDENITQLSILSAEGSGFLIQVYNNLNPAAITDFMLQEVTKESRSYGYVEKKENYDRKLNSGQTVKVTRSSLKYKDDENIYEVAAFGKKDEGVLVVTIRINQDENSNGNQIIRLLWNSLAYK